jgi:hypothetical protein
VIIKCFVVFSVYKIGDIHKKVKMDQLKMF